MNCSNSSRTWFRWRSRGCAGVSTLLVFSSAFLPPFSIGAAGMFTSLLLPPFSVGAAGMFTSALLCSSAAVLFDAGIAYMCAIIRQVRDWQQSCSIKVNHKQLKLFSIMMLVNQDITKKNVQSDFMHYLFCWQQIIILCHHCYDLLHHFLFKLQAFASLLPSQHLSVPSVVEVDESLLPNL